ncbi:MAG: hypothetical protein FVQ79_11180 [Planctomycetes bacterium]|nr:hypothetical protein [Planctomycetota bacterium]
MNGPFYYVRYTLLLICTIIAVFILFSNAAAGAPIEGFYPEYDVYDHCHCNYTRTEIFSSTDEYLRAGRGTTDAFEIAL